eukprot:scaffold62187_cov21-Tisochrysis_lutea.AAC.1
MHAMQTSLEAVKEGVPIGGAVGHTEADRASKEDKAAAVQVCGTEATAGTRRSWCASLHRCCMQTLLFLTSACQLPYPNLHDLQPVHSCLSLRAYPWRPLEQPSRYHHVLLGTRQRTRRQAARFRFCGQSAITSHFASKLCCGLDCAGACSTFAREAQHICRVSYCMPAFEAKKAVGALFQEQERSRRACTLRGEGVPRGYFNHGHINHHP